MENVPVPYFITNDDWYYYDEDKEIYILTDEAPEEAKRSYKEYYEGEDDE